MEKADLQKLADMLDQKISFMEDYESITMKLTIDEVDSLKNLIAARQEIIEKVNIIDKNIKEIISEQSIQRQKTLKKLFAMNKTDEKYSDNMTILKDKLIKLKEVLLSIQAKEQIVSNRLADYKNKLFDEFTKLSKGKQVIDYMDMTSKSDLYTGSKFDQNS